jgi:hypothetical protein
VDVGRGEFADSAGTDGSKDRRQDVLVLLDGLRRPAV